MSATMNTWMLGRGASLGRLKSAFSLVSACAMLTVANTTTANAQSSQPAGQRSNSNATTTQTTDTPTKNRRPRPTHPSLTVPQGPTTTRARGADVAINPDSRGCYVRIELSAGRSGLIYRPITISDLSWLASQYGALDEIQIVDNRLSQEMVELIISKHVGHAVLNLEGYRDETCQTLYMVAARLNERVQNNEWPEENLREAHQASVGLVRVHFPKPTP
jgi:hypothetical protein